MVELARVATLLLQDLQGGKIQAQYTLQEFLSQVQSIPKSTDFSRIAKDMAETRRRLSQKEEGNQQKLDPAKAENNKPAALGKPGAIVGKPKKVDQENNKDHQFQGWSVAQLQKQCAEWGLQKSGKKADLIQRLKGPRPPQLWLERKKRDVGYVPTRHNTCATALLVALYLEQRQHQDDTTGSSWQGTPKEELYPIAEALNISKDPFSGIASSGPFQYDGWSSMSDLKSGELPLVVLKRGRFRLTTSSEVSGFQLAEAMHQWCHAHKNCSCQQLGYDHCIDDG